MYFLLAEGYTRNKSTLQMQGAFIIPKRSDNMKKSELLILRHLYNETKRAIPKNWIFIFFSKKTINSMLERGLIKKCPYGHIRITLQGIEAYLKETKYDNSNPGI
nr:MAG TPA: hypothetical protein [Caudoviricetes sp.]